MKQLLYATVLSLLLCPPVMADDLGDVEKMIEERIETVISALQDKTLDQQSKNEKVIRIVEPVFDFELMAKLSLGKKYWPDLSAAKRQEFIKVFTERLKDSYLEKLELYTDEKVAYEKPLRVKGRIHMPTFLISKDNKYSMLYKLYKSDRGWLIYDIEIEGVSVIQTYRSQFDGVLKNGAIDDLLEKLKTPGQIAIGSDKP